jgi:Icc-related predicted phosphoesterase
MKLLIVSDIHQEESVIGKLKELKDREKPDHFLVCGDVSGAVTFAKEFLEAFPDVFIVPGNWDSQSVNGVLTEAKNYVHRKRIVLDEFNLVGFGYSNITPFDTFGELSEDKIYSQMSELEIDEHTLLLLHCPPKGFFDIAKGVHVGSESIRKIIEEKKPFCAFFGHVHEHQGSQEYQSTRLVKVPAAIDCKACIVELNGKVMKVKFVII